MKRRASKPDKQLDQQKYQKGKDKKINKRMRIKLKPEKQTRVIAGRMEQDWVDM